MIIYYNLDKNTVEISDIGSFKNLFKDETDIRYVNPADISPTGNVTIKLDGFEKSIYLKYLNHGTIIKYKNSKNQSKTGIIN